MIVVIVNSAFFLYLYTLVFSMLRSFLLLLLNKLNGIPFIKAS